MLNFMAIVYILRKTIEGYVNSFDYITVEKIISIQGIFVSDRTTNMQFSRMQNKIHGSLVTIQYHTKCTNPLYPKFTSKKFSVYILVFIVLNARDGTESKYPSIVFLSLYAGRGAQWLTDRVLDSRSRGCGFGPHQRHCVVFLSKTLSYLLSTGSTEEDLVLT